VARAARVESVSQPVRAQQASPRPAHLEAREPEPSAQLLVPEARHSALSSSALRGQQAQRASPPAQQVLPEQPEPASRPQGQHSLAGVPQLPLASFVQPSPRHPSLLFLP
jgi:hypothetical protein